MRFEVVEITNIERDSDDFVTNDPTFGPAIEVFDAEYPALARNRGTEMNPNKRSWIDAGTLVVCAWEDGNRILGIIRGR